MKNKQIIKIYHVAGWPEYSNWVPNRQIVDNIKDADVVFFEGGEDVYPKLYGAKTTSLSHFNKERDRKETIAFLEAQKHGKPCWGTCRGSQFLCVMSSGQLIQDMRHNSSHEINLIDGRKITVTSTHHQMQYPFDTLSVYDYYIIGWATDEERTKMAYLEQNINIQPKKDVEICWYRNTNSMCVQGHPELSWATQEFKDLSFDLLNSLINQTVTNDFKPKKKPIEQIRDMNGFVMMHDPFNEPDPFPPIDENNQVHELGLEPIH